MFVYVLKFLLVDWIVSIFVIVQCDNFGFCLIESFFNFFLGFQRVGFWFVENEVFLEVGMMVIDGEYFIFEIKLLIFLI